MLIWLAKTASRYSLPRFGDFVSNQRAFTAACELQRWYWMGKSCRSQGMWYFVAASLSNGFSRAQLGHSRSANSISATFAPGGGFSAVWSMAALPCDAVPKISAQAP